MSYFFCRVPAATSFSDGASIEWTGRNVAQLDDSNRARRVALLRSRDVVEVMPLGKKDLNRLRRARTPALEIIVADLDGEQREFVVLDRAARSYFSSINSKPDDDAPGDQEG